jgi:hypothetical protein
VLLDGTLQSSRVFLAAKIYMSRILRARLTNFGSMLR